MLRFSVWQDLDNYICLHFAMDIVEVCEILIQLKAQILFARFTRVLIILIRKIHVNYNSFQLNECV